MTEWGSLLTDDAIVCVKARVDKREDEPKLMCLEVRRPEITFEAVQELHLRFPDTFPDDLIADMRRLLEEYPGDAGVVLHFGKKVVRLKGGPFVDPSSRLLAELRVLLGPNAIV
jgi:DNA polymerase-3 subunit alpha